MSKLLFQHVISIKYIVYLGYIYFRLATYHGLKSHMWLMATKLNNVVVESNKKQVVRIGGVLFSGKIYYDKVSVMFRRR